MFPGVKKNNTTVCLFCFYSCQATIFCFFWFFILFFLLFSILNSAVSFFCYVFFFSWGLCGY
ncbi:hypothetical protein B6Q59_29000 [Escherichia coli]|nr:hypothetical protein [Escherichia coli]